jgi:hopene-associated glycosyltransferase HpnB
MLFWRANTYGDFQMTTGLAFAAAAFAVWLYLIFGRGGFWRTAARENSEIQSEPLFWPRVVVVLPARNEAEVIGGSISSLFNQDYPGLFSVILVDDQSTDDTAGMGKEAADRAHASDRLTVLNGRSLPSGWTGKLWAMKQGVDQADSFTAPPHYILFTDADIAFSPDALRRLVARAEAQHLVLTSWMVKLRCDSTAERALVPAFVFFFQMLYPFSWVNRAGNSTAAAAGGCMLVQRDALTQAGGIEAIRSALIDDCALGRRLKSVGPVWLGLTERAHSLRPYPELGDIWRMVSRSAYDQLGYSPMLLAGVVAGLALTFLVAPLCALFGTGLTQLFGALAWGLMALAFQPMLRFYRVSPLWGAALPVIAALYLMFTLDSAYQHWRGRGGMWKGRVQAGRS